MAWIPYVLWVRQREHERCAVTWDWEGGGAPYLMYFDIFIALLHSGSAAYKWSLPLYTGWQNFLLITISYLLLYIKIQTSHFSSPAEWTIRGLHQAGEVKRVICIEFLYLVFSLNFLFELIIIVFFVALVFYQFFQLLFMVLSFNLVFFLVISPKKFHFSRLVQTGLDFFFLLKSYFWKLLLYVHSSKLYYLSCNFHSQIFKYLIFLLKKCKLNVFILNITGKYSN